MRLPDDVAAREMQALLGAALRRFWHWLSIVVGCVLLVAWCVGFGLGAWPSDKATLVGLTWQCVAGLLCLRVLLAWFYPLPGDVFPSPVEHPMRHWHTLSGTMSPAHCAALIQAAEARPWTQERHTVATLDQPLQALEESAAFVHRLLAERWLPTVAELYGLAREDLGLKEAFVVKYDASLQTHLPYHRDASILTLSIALNDASEYRGGGTHFPSIARTVSLVRPGDMLIHCGKIQHGGRHVEEGCRYILVCFLDCERCDAFDHEEIARWDSLTPDDETVMARLYRK